mgnify:CR=1 FL=1
MNLLQAHLKRTLRKSALNLLIFGDVMARVQLVGKPNCHLCEQAEKIVSEVCAELGVGWEYLSIFDDPALADQFAEFIPVVLIDGAVHDQFGVSETRFRKAVADLS